MAIPSKPVLGWYWYAPIPGLHALMKDLPKLSPPEYKRLLEDIREKGVLVPILVDAATGETLDGRERERCCEVLGIKNIPRVVIGNLTDQERQEIRIKANVLRRHLTSQQVRQWLRWEIRSDPTQSDRTIAGKIGCSHHTVGKQRETIGQSAQCDRRTKDGRSYPAKRKPIIQTHTRHSTREASRLLSELGDTGDGGPSTLRDARTAAWHQRRKVTIDTFDDVALDKQYQCRQGDFRVLAQWVGSNVCDIVWADPPWVAEWKPNRKDFAKACASMLKPNGILIAQCGVDSLLQFADIYRAAGLSYWWSCVMLRQTATIRTTRVRSQWCPVLIFTKGLKRLKPYGILGDVVQSDGPCKNLHVWQSPVEQYSPILMQLSHPNSIIADLCLGTGTTPLAVAKCNQDDGGHRRFLGGDLEARNCKVAKSRVAEILEAQKPTKKKKAAKFL